MILLALLADLLFVFSNLSLSTPVAAHLLHVIYHLVIGGTFWCRSSLSGLLQPICEVLAFLLHIRVDVHFIVPACCMFISLLPHLHFCGFCNVLDRVLLVSIALFDPCEILLDLLL